MCVATVVEKVTINITSVLHQLSLHWLKAIIFACGLESYYDLECCRSEIIM